MNKAESEVDEMRAEYDFSKGVRGKYATQYAEGTNVVVLEPDLDAYARVRKSLRLLARGRKATYTRFRRQHRRGLSARRWDRPFSA